ncbi:cytochrome C oxidase assembly protein [Marinovum sp.]|uniref:cytochrome C oxidase assembly protein n=1 Tax=Marinovum sp. TaxID=2024839 RepID=UPI002B2679DF|nr:cytochrome C oxidase assembly protein [Marinovum sp.]
MNFQPEHELHRRRKGRNTGVGLVLAALIVIVFGLTYVKVTSQGFRDSAPAVQEAG